MGNTSSFTDRIEETLFAGILGMMTIITFANVVRYGFNQNILWVLEQTVFLFGWLVLLGAFYAVKDGFTLASISSSTPFFCMIMQQTVSYTHLTLPTIHSV